MRDMTGYDGYERITRIWQDKKDMKGYDRIWQDIEPEDSASGPYKSSERSPPSVISLISESVTGGASAAGGTLPPTFLSFRPTIFATPLTVAPLLLQGFQLPELVCFAQLAYVPKALSHTLQTKVLIVASTDAMPVAWQCVATIAVLAETQIRPCAPERCQVVGPERCHVSFGASSEACRPVVRNLQLIDMKGFEG